ncbi:MAG: CYTH domain-containing protein [Eubacteriales bacterium]
MEIEMKYSIKDKETSDLIWEDDYINSLADENSRENIYMKAAYFDTEDKVLSAKDIAFRVRKEGNRVVASLKWNGESSDGRHKREEINVPVNDEACFITPDPSIFKESEDGRWMLKILGGKELVNVLETRFFRRKVRIDTGECICEVAIDIGEIVTDSGSEPICELEIELFSGSEESLKEIGALIAEKYQLVPENRSKYARGLRILK